MEDLPKTDRILSFTDCLRIVSKILNLDQNAKEEILKFHKIRNEIQHRATNIPLNKGEAIANFSPSLDELYIKMFPEFKDAFPEIKPNEGKRK